jgi:transposase
VNEFSKYVGLDVHKETIAVSVAEARGGEVRYLGEIGNTPQALTKLVRQLGKQGERLSFCYEAGPCGYGVYRQLLELKQACMVVAPSLIPRRTGERVKTDRRDSLSLDLPACGTQDGGAAAARRTHAAGNARHCMGGGEVPYI